MLPSRFNNRHDFSTVFIERSLHCLDGLPFMRSLTQMTVIKQALDLL